MAEMGQLTLLAAPALAVIVAWAELPGADRMSQAANLAVLGPLGFGWAGAPARSSWGFERRLRLRPSYVRMTEEITALHARPELRPVEPSPPSERGRLLGPALLLVIGLAVTAVLIT